MINSFTTSTYDVTLTSVSTYESTALSYKAGITASTSSIYESTSSYKSFNIISTESGVAEANVFTTTSDVSRGEYTATLTSGVPNSSTSGVAVWTDMLPCETTTFRYTDDSYSEGMSQTGTFTASGNNVKPFVSDSAVNLTDARLWENDIIIDNKHVRVESGTLTHRVNTVTLRMITQTEALIGAMTFYGVKETTGSATSCTFPEPDENDNITYINAVWKIEKQTSNYYTNKLVTKTFSPKVTGRQESLIAETNRVTEYLNDLYYSSTGTTLRSTISSLSTETTLGSTVVSSDTLVYSEQHDASTVITDLYTKRSVVGATTRPASYSTWIVVYPNIDDEDDWTSASTSVASAANTVSTIETVGIQEDVTVTYSRVTTDHYLVRLNNGLREWASLDQWLFRFNNEDTAYYSVNYNVTLYNSSLQSLAESEMLDNIITLYSDFTGESSIWQSITIIST